MAPRDNNIDISALLKRAIELVMPNLRAYYRLPVKATVVKTYASDGNYWADVQPIRNDESKNEAEPVIPKVEIPVIWGGPMRGVVCPIPKGTYVTVSFHDGDPDYPFISHVRWHKNKAPACEVDAFIIQMAPGCHIKIDAEKNILEMTPANKSAEIGGDLSFDITGNVSIAAGGNVTVATQKDATITASGNIKMSASMIDMN